MGEIVQRSPQQEIVARVRQPDFLEQVKLALPGNMPAERFVRATVTALIDNPDIAASDPNALFQAVIRAAQDGLMPDGIEAALVLFNDRERGKVATYMPMIGGLRKIAAEYGWTLRSAVVHEHDQFEFSDDDVRFARARPGISRGPMIGAYAKATHRSGEWGTLVEFMDVDELEKVRATSRAKNTGPWKDWTERMYEKTVGRRLFKQLPLAAADRERINRVIAADELEPGQAAKMIYGHELDAGDVQGARPQTAIAESPSTPSPESGATGLAAPSTGPTGEASGEGNESATAAPDEPGASLPASSPDPGNDEAVAPEQSSPNAAAADGEHEASPIGSGSADGSPEPEPETPQSEVTTTDLVASMAGAEPEPVRPPGSGFRPPANVEDTPEVVSAKLAAEVLIVEGQNEGKPLKALLDAGATGEKWMRWCLNKDWPPEQYAFQEAAWAFARIFMPDVYEHVFANKPRDPEGT